MNLLEATNYYLGEGPTFKPRKQSDIVSLLTNLGWFMSANTMAIQQTAKDVESKKQLELMQKQFRSPMINGMPLYTALETPTKLDAPELRSKLIRYVYDMLMYIEPRLKLYMDGSDQTKNILNRLENVKKEYVDIVTKK